MNTQQQIQKQIKILESRLSRFTTESFKSQVVGLILEIERLEGQLEQIEEKVQPKTRTLKLETPRRVNRSWVAKLSPEKDPRYGGFQKSFIEPKERTFGKKGEVSARFEIEIDLNAIYQDSDGDYWYFENLEGDIETICYEEVKYRFSKIA